MGSSFSYDFIINSLAEGVFAVDKDLTIRSLNPAGSKITGWLPEETIGRKCYEIFKNPACDRNCALRKVLTNEVTNSMSQVVVKGKHNQMLLLKVSCMPLKDHEGNIIGGLQIFSDQRKLFPSSSVKFHQMGLIGHSKSMLEVYRLVEAVAPTETTVLITGESGTGKELIANAIHKLSTRKNMPFVKVNCAALSETLLESELFGHTKGAFTGALADRKGRFEAAHNGTIFLDEIAETGPAFQAKLLRVTQEGEFERVGSSKTIKVNLRIIAATNRNLEAMVQENKFRADLFYRLNVFPIHLEPLRNRKEDIKPLIEHFINEFNLKFKTQVLKVSDEASKLLHQYDYPGNVRELKNIIEYAFVRTKGVTIQAEDLPKRVKDHNMEAGKNNLLSGNKPSRETILEVIEQCGGNKSAAAKVLGISRKTLYNWLNQ